jgi:hypothetical protein
LKFDVRVCVYIRTDIGRIPLGATDSIVWKSTHFNCVFTEEGFPKHVLLSEVLRRFKLIVRHLRSVFLQQRVDDGFQHSLMDYGRLEQSN